MSEKKELQSTVELAAIKLEKALAVLNRVGSEYLEWREAPSPVAAIQYLNGVPMDEDGQIHGQHSAEWCLGYAEICSFVSIVEDYIFATQKLLSEAAKGKA